MRIYSSVTETTDLRRAADRTEMVPAIVDYMAALNAAMLASSTGGDPQAALTEFDSSRQELQRRLSDTDIADDVSKGVTSMIDNGQALMDKVTSNSINLFERVTTYAPILLTAEDAINGSVRVDDEHITAETLGLSRAIGARGQMMMQQLLVNLGAELPEPELRTRMIALAGTEPSTLFGMSQVLGVGSTEAQKLQDEMVRRLAIMSDPLAVLVNNPDLRASEAVTDQIAGQIITDDHRLGHLHSGGAGVGAARSGDPRRGDRRWRVPAGADRRHPGRRDRSFGRCAGCGTARCGWPTTTWPEKSSTFVPVATRAHRTDCGAHLRGGGAGRTRRR